MPPAGRSPQETLERPAAIPGGSPSDEALLALFAMSDPGGSAAFIGRFERRVFGLARMIVGEPRAADGRRAGGLAQGVASRRHVRRPTRQRRDVGHDHHPSRRDQRTPGATRSLSWLPTISSAGPAPSMTPPMSPCWVMTSNGCGQRSGSCPMNNAALSCAAGIWGITAGEIAERDGIPLGTAKTRIRLASTRLRDALLRDE